MAAVIFRSYLYVIGIAPRFQGLGKFCFVCVMEFQKKEFELCCIICLVKFDVLRVCIKVTKYFSWGDHIRYVRDAID